MVWLLSMQINFQSNILMWIFSYFCESLFGISMSRNRLTRSFHSIWNADSKNRICAFAINIPTQPIAIFWRAYMLEKHIIQTTYDVYLWIWSMYWCWLMLTSIFCTHLLHAYFHQTLCIILHHSLVDIASNLLMFQIFFSRIPNGAYIFFYVLYSNGYSRKWNIVLSRKEFSVYLK